MAKKKKKDDAEETHDERRVRYTKMYDVDTLASMCVEAEEEYERQSAQLSRLQGEKSELRTALVEARAAFTALHDSATEHGDAVADILTRTRRR